MTRTLATTSLAVVLLAAACTEDETGSGGIDAGTDVRVGGVDTAGSPDTANPDVASVADAGSEVATDTAAGAHPMMTFFLTSTGSGELGGNLGGLEGADAKCQQLAAAVGAGNKTWVAWLSIEQGPNGQPVHAKDRVGAGPWHDSKGRLVAMTLADLLPGPDMRPKGEAEAVNDLVDENGLPTSRSPLHHDILTGTLATGLVSPGHTCGDWKGTTGIAQIGHSDNRGPFSWTESHPSQGCTMAGVSAGGGNGRFYCFAKR